MGSWKKGGFLVLCIWVGLEWMESLKCWGTSLVAIRYPRTAWKYFLLEAREASQQLHSFHHGYWAQIAGGGG